MIILLTCLPIAHLLLLNLHPKYRHYDDPLGQLRMTTQLGLFQWTTTLPMTMTGPLDSHEYHQKHCPVLAHH